MKMLDADHKNAFELVNSDHNMIICGQAGVGKTHLVKHIVQYKRKEQKHVSVVCSTGIAATHYGNLGSQTLHKWAGLEDGRHLNEELLHLIKTDERFLHVKANIECTDLLIIDEVSMISTKVLNQLEFVCRHVRKSDSYFGNMQVVLVGDFYQLPPVSNELLGDPGNHCFKLPWFNDCFPHKIKLNIIHRQDDINLIKCINEMEIGEPSDETIAFLLSLSRPIQNQVSSVNLFSRNLYVDLFNYNKLETLPGELKVYQSVDEGSSHYLAKFMAPKNLGIKVGCPVMLVKNLSDTLVNGLQGTVIKTFEESVDVKFTINDKTISTNIKPATFTTFDPVDKIVISKRVQLPLKLSYAMTIHKAQGMSLNNVVVNCQDCIQPGQIGVAIGRAVTVEGLQVVNFKKSMVRKHPQHVTEFHEKISIGSLKRNLSCCRNKIKEKETIVETEEGDNECDNLDSDSDFSDNEIDLLQSVDSCSEPPVDMSVDETPSKYALDTVIKEFNDTPTEKDILHFKTLILRNFQHFDTWYEAQFSVIDDIGLNCLPEGEKKITQ